MLLVIPVYIGIESQLGTCDIDSERTFKRRGGYHVDWCMANEKQAKREPSKVSDGPTRPAKVPRKVKANKELEAGKCKWQEFAMKGEKGKVVKKESMFQTPDGVNARGKMYCVRAICVCS